MTDRPFNVLFLCTGNSARSILAEGILRKDGAGRFNAFSAGSEPKGQVNPFALKTLEAYDYPSHGYRSKSWDEFAGPGAPVMDFVFTVCDSAAGEACPLWPGQPVTAHWGIEDPAAVEGTHVEKERAFNQAFRFMKNRISAFLSLPLRSLDAVALTSRVQDIGTLEGATHPNVPHTNARPPEGDRHGCDCLPQP
jgi:arsenate reductase